MVLAEPTGPEVFVIAGAANAPTVQRRRLKLGPMSGEVVSVHVIARPHSDTDTVLPGGK